MTVSEYTTLGILIAAVVVSVWLGFLRREF
jgi:hypothetical protein